MQMTIEMRTLNLCILIWIENLQNICLCFSRAVRVFLSVLLDCDCRVNLQAIVPSIQIFDIEK